MLYIVVATDEGLTYGIYKSREAAKQKIEQLYAEGFYGHLRIVEDELKE